MKKQLRIGFLIGDQETLPAWYAWTLQRIMQQGHQALLIQQPSASAHLPRRHWAYRLFTKFEETWFGKNHDALGPASVPDVTTSLQLTQRFWANESEAAALKSLQLDLIYTMDYDGSTRENLSDCAGFGLWYIRLGSGAYAGLQPAAFREVMENSAVTGSALIMRKKNRNLLLYEGSTLSVPYSVKNNRNSQLWKTASYLAYRVYTLSVLYDEFEEQFPSIAAPHMRHRLPGNLEMIGLFFKNVAGYLHYKWKSYRQKERFGLYYSFEKKEDFLPASFQSLTVPEGYFHADPFVVHRQGAYFLFYESYSYAQGKAVIEMRQWKAGQWTEPVVVLNKPYHLSYPFVFEHEGVYYMIPETSSHKTVELYRAKQFPFEWEWVTNLFEDRSLIDVTLHFHEDRWWLFANTNTHPATSTNDQLLLFYSQDLFTPSWTPHPMNPVATHARNCRPAGRLFYQNGKLYRPAQNNASRIYGYGLTINEVLQMDPVHYQEVPVQELDPASFGKKALHHLDSSGALTIIDGVPL